VATPEKSFRSGARGACRVLLFVLRVRKFFWPIHLSAVYPTFDEMHWNVFVSFGYLAAFA